LLQHQQQLVWIVFLTGSLLLSGFSELLILSWTIGQLVEEENSVNSEVKEGPIAAASN
jgi:hypothetical protein